MGKYYVTTPIYYVNDVPHIGHAYTTVIADAYARWHRLLGDDVFFLTGLDEHSKKTVTAAEKKGMDVLAFTDFMAEKWKSAWKVLNISNDDFIRTTDKRHEKNVVAFIKSVYEQGDIYKGKYEGLYCEGCEGFVTEKDLVNGECPLHKKPCKRLVEENYFFKLSKYNQKLIDYIEQNPKFIWPESRRNEVMSFLKEGARDISITRPKSEGWGITCPFEKDQVIWVWFDALINYLLPKKYWPATVHFMAKDILRFHAVIWPGMLMSAGKDIPKCVAAHGFMTINGQKMSKSLGNIIDPLFLSEKYSADALRYYLIRYLPAGEDGDFSEKSLTAIANADLGDSLGNLCRRVCVLVQKYFAGDIPSPDALVEADKELVDFANNLEDDVKFLMENYQWHRASARVWEFLHAINRYVTVQEPWKIEDKKRLSTVLYVCVESLRVAANFVSPFVPGLGRGVLEQLGQKEGGLKFSLKTKGKLPEPGVLFKKIDDKSDVFEIVDLKVAEVLDAKPHPNADKLLVLTINCEKKRTLCAGIKNYYAPEKLIGKHIVVVSNLKPAKLRGIESEGMLLAAEKDGKVVVLEAPKSSPGEQVFVEGVSPKGGIITIDDFGKIKLTTKGKKVVYTNKILKTAKEDIVADVGDNAVIK